jgi:hypothetical protein
MGRCVGEPASVWKMGLLSFVLCPLSFAPTGLSYVCILTNVNFRKVDSAIAGEVASQARFHVGQTSPIAELEDTIPASNRQVALNSLVLSRSLSRSYQTVVKS